MTTFTADRVFEGASNSTSSGEKLSMDESSLHNGPVARLLARVSRWSDLYASYQMESGAWRKMAV